MTDSDIAPRALPRRSPVAIFCLVGCVLLLSVYATLTWKAVRTKAPIIDEPLDVIGASATRELGDFRVNYEDPPLWHYWASLPNSDVASDLNLSSPLWPKVLQDTTSRFDWIRETFNQPQAKWIDRVNRSRAMMLMIGIGLGAAIGAAAWRFGGPFAALVAVAFYAFDPNFLGHGSLVKNDVANALTFVLVALAIDAVGRRASWKTVIVLGLACGVALSTKFSGVLVVPIVVLALIVRAILPIDWSVFGSASRTPGDRAFLSLRIGAVAFFVAIVFVWGCYRFRFAATPQGQQVDMQHVVLFTAQSDIRARNPAVPFQQTDLDVWTPPLMVNLLLLPYRFHAMPQAWDAGLIYTYGSSLYRGTYLLGQIGRTGWWYYFPLAILFKTPTATLIAGLLATLAAIGLAISRRKSLASAHLWKVAVIAIPVIVYGAAALTTNLNLGLRHVFPLYALFYIALGWVASRLIARGRTAAIITGAVAALLFVGTAVESTVAYPNYIAFFNAPSGGSRGGVRLLSDNNIDWGQDLALLAQWQKAHPDERLYVSCLLSVDPALYGIQFQYVPGADVPRGETVTQWPSEPGVLAVSVTKMHGQNFANDAARAYYRKLTSGEPIAVLGGSIYLFRYTPPEP